MESESISKTNSKLLRVTNDKMSLEDYLAFFHSHKQLDVTINFLNQIIVIHGFKKIYKLPKKVLIDAVNTIDLIDPSRNTLKENISSCALLTLEDVIADLNELNWQECCVTSLQTLNSWKESLSTHHNPGLQSTELSNPKSQPQAPKTTPFGASGYVLEGASSSCGSEIGHRTKKHVPKRKRRVVEAGGDGGDRALYSNCIVPYRSE